MLPAEYHARCTHSGCSWHVDTTDADYRDTLTTQHTARYGHATESLDLP